jgi:hypothetical protein
MYTLYICYGISYKAQPQLSLNPNLTATTPLYSWPGAIYKFRGKAEPTSNPQLSSQFYFSFSPPADDRPNKSNLPLPPQPSPALLYLDRSFVSKHSIVKVLSVLSLM